MECIQRPENSNNPRFLWVYLHMRSITKSETTSTKKSILAQIGEFPEGLEDTYTHSLKRIEGSVERDRKFGFAILVWMRYAKRPMTTSEMITAAIQYCRTKYGKINLEPNQVQPTTIAATCCQLVEVEGHIVRFRHLTVKSFLEDKMPEGFEKSLIGELWSCKGRLLVTRACIQYINDNEFEKMEREKAVVESAYPLIRYAADRWDEHVRDSEKELESEPDFKISLFSNSIPSEQRFVA